MKLGLRQRRVLAVLEGAAARGAICPTDAALGDAIGSEPKVAAEAFGELRDLGVIDVLSFHRARQVTIVASGSSTAAVEGKPHWRVRRGLLAS